MRICSIRVGANNFMDSLGYEVATYECGPLHVITVTGPGLKAGASALTAEQARMVLREALCPDTWKVDCMHVELDLGDGTLEYLDESVNITAHGVDYYDAYDMLCSIANAAKKAV